MIENKIHAVDSDSVAKIVQKAKISTNTYLVEIQGKEIQSWKDYIAEIEEKFEFPTSCISSIDRYLDWIRDLGWLKKDSYVLVIYDYKNFLEQDISLKKMIMEDFGDCILPWWQEEVKICVAGGKEKAFNVYIVE